MVKDPFVVPSAHRHGVAAKDATHAWRNAIRSFDVEEDMVLLIGPDEAGRLLEDRGGLESTASRRRDRSRHAREGSLSGGVTEMPRSLQEILDSADALADAFEAFEPVDQKRAAILAKARRAAASRAEAERELFQSVVEARSRNISWAAIGRALGTSGEAARLRYGPLITG